MSLLLIPVLVGALLVVAGQALPPFHLLTHEFTQVFTALGAVGWAWVASSRSLRQVGQAPAAALWGNLAGALALGLGAWLAHLVADGPVHGCRTSDGSAFFWVTWTPAAVLAAVLGTLAGAAGWSRPRRVVALIALMLGCIVHDVGQAVVGVDPVDPLLGELVLLDQRADLAPRLLHVLHAGWLVLLAVTAWLAGTNRLRPGVLARAGATVGLALLAGFTFVGGSDLGLGWGDGHIRARLDQVLRTEHFVLHYPAGGEASLMVRRIAVEAEWDWYLLARDLGLPDDFTVELRIFDSPEQMEALTGLRAAHAWLGRVDIPADNALSTTLRHELFHAVHWELLPALGIVLNRGLIEGAAEAWENALVVDPVAHRDAASLLANGELPSARDVFSVTGFWKVREGVAYRAAGSFLGWLVLEHGVPPFVELGRSLDFEATYGADLDTLDRQWRAFLSTVPVSLDERAQQRRWLSDPRWQPYLDQRCPKLGPLSELAEVEARRREARRDHEVALRLYEELWAERHDPAFALGAARARVAQGDTAGARTLLADASTLPDLPEDQRRDLLDMELQCALVDGDWPGAVALLQRVRALEDSEDLAVLQRALSNPDVQQSTAEAMLAEGDERSIALAALQARFPDNADVRFLVATQGVALPSAPWYLAFTRAERQRFDRLAAEVAASATLCDAVFDEVAPFGVAAARIGEEEVAGRAAALMLDHCHDPYHRFSARRLAERVAWEVDR